MKDLSPSAPLALIVAPFWRQPQHVGNKRIARFLRWFHTLGWQTLVIRAGTTDHQQDGHWGPEITVTDPLGLHPDPGAPGPSPLRRREYDPLTRLAATLVFNPDPGIVWVRRILRHQQVRQAAARAELILASSPPESVHLAALALSTAGPARLWVDMRDGWLDEPLKPALHRSSLQRHREGRLERRVFAAAERILVSSPVWQALLLERYPALQSRVAVLTGSCPDDQEAAPPLPPAGDRTLRLVHAGQFAGSKFNNRPGLLLAPLLEGAGEIRQRLEIILQGRFLGSDLREIGHWQERFAARGHRLETRPPVPAEALAETLRQAHGLLLLSATRASLLAKLFDYLPSGRPILAVTPPGSAVWREADRIPRMFPVPLHPDPESLPAVGAFLQAAASGQPFTELPGWFREEQVFRIFRTLLATR